MDNNNQQNPIEVKKRLPKSSELGTPTISQLLSVSVTCGVSKQEPNSKLMY